MSSSFRMMLAKRGLVCPKTGRFLPIRRARGIATVLMPVIGLLAVIWFLVRVIPKPSRATYPCMRAAAPLASGFITWIAGVPVFTALVPRISRHARSLRIGVLALAAAVTAVAVVTVCSTTPPAPVRFPNNVVGLAAAPIGVAQGIFPGRVVWEWDPAATNENLTNTPGDGWFLAKNNDPEAIGRMMSDGLQTLTGQPSDKEAWDALFKYHNGRHGSPAGYRTGQRIFVKINAVSAWWGNFDPGDLSIVPNNVYGNAETDPFTVLALLRQLVRVVGVREADIYVGDPISHLYKHVYDVLHSEFPDVHYLDHDFGAEKGREKTTYTASPVIFYSDHGSLLRANQTQGQDSKVPIYSDTLCSLVETADYIINCSALKGHKRAGVSLCAKNHFGTQGGGSAFHLHNGLVNPTELDASRQGYGRYRVQVDLMGHRMLGGKTLAYLVDALYAGPEAVDPPTRWDSAPFHHDWTSSLFFSLDPVAMESVGYDFLRNEYTADTAYSWVQMSGVDDYLHQAADRSAWPAGIVYDPENDGTPIGSLGVHEHWNNARDKQYTRNLGTGEGIELVKRGARFEG